MSECGIACVCKGRGMAGAFLFLSLLLPVLSPCPLAMIRRPSLRRGVRALCESILALKEFFCKGCERLSSVSSARRESFRTGVPAGRLVEIARIRRLILARTGGLAYTGGFHTAGVVLSQ